jgi:hypothetical protein
VAIGGAHGIDRLGVDAGGREILLVLAVGGIRLGLGDAILTGQLSLRPNPSDDAPLRNPITGIGCCAHAASGHAAAAPPTSVMNSRRFMAQ